MGGLFKSKSKKTTEKTTSHQDQQNWLADNPAYAALVNKAIGEANSYNLPDYQLAGVSQETKNQLNALTKGVDLSSYTQSADFLKKFGQGEMNAAKQSFNNYNNVLGQLGDMSQSDYSNMIQNEINGSLTQGRINQLQTNLNEQTGTAINALNRQAGGGGNMGNSRAGVAQGIIQGKAANALTSGIVDIQSAEEQLAGNRVSNYLQTRFNAATTGLQAAQNQQQFGFAAFNQGQTYNSQYNAGYLQNIQNSITAQDQLRAYQQQTLDVNRQNQLQRMSPALNRLMYANQGLLPVANFQTTGNSTGTTTTIAPGQGSLGQSLLGMGGAVVGGMIGGPAGAQLGGMFGSMAGGAMTR